MVVNTDSLWPERKDKLVCFTAALCSSLSCISLSRSPSLSIFLPIQVTPMLSPLLSSHTPLPLSNWDSFIRVVTLSVRSRSLSSSVLTSACVVVVRSLAKMSLPVNSDYLSLERIARYRHACSSGSPYATNKPIDIKPRGRRGYDRSDTQTVCVRVYQLSCTENV